MKHAFRNLLRLAFACAGLVSNPLSAAESYSPGPVPTEVREKFQLAPFYQKYLDAGGLPIVGSEKVSDDAIAECAWIVRQMLAHRPEVLAALGDAGVRFAVMAHNEYTTDVPEHSALKPQVYWDRRARGLGATPEAPAVSCGEENLLAFPGDPYPTENIGIHEFAHAIHALGLGRLDSAFDEKLKQTYQQALENGLWKGTYAAVNRQEYWAEAVQCWFDNNRENDSLHNHVNTRAELKEYDPQLAALCEQVFGDRSWRYQKPADRAPDGRMHLKTWKPDAAPRFQWRTARVPDQPRITLQCAEGEMELELDTQTQGESVTAFLKAVHLGCYSNGHVQWTNGALHLEPASELPSGEPVSGQNSYRIVLISSGEAVPEIREALRAKLAKGAVLIHKLSHPPHAGTSVPIQRIVRLN